MAASSTVVSGGTSVGRFVTSSAVLEVASKLQTEGLARLSLDAEGAVTALRQAFELERRFGEDGVRLCEACTALNRGLTRVAHPSPPAESVTVLLQALDTLDEREARFGSGRPIEVNSRLEAVAHDFLARELLGLARRLGGGSLAGVTAATSQPSSPKGTSSLVRDPSGSGANSPRAPATAAPPPPPRLDELRAADRAYERLAQLAGAAPLKLGGKMDLVVTQVELLFQLSQQARAIGTTLMASNTARDTEAAVFYFSRALRKLRLAGMGERDPHTLALRQLHAQAEAQMERLRAAPPPSAASEASALASSKDAPPAADDDYYCAVS